MADCLQGYILYSMRKKLKPELVGRSQEEVKQLRLSGQEVTDTYQVRDTHQPWVPAASCVLAWLGMVWCALQPPTCWCFWLRQVPEVAFTGDTSGELFEKDGNPDIYRAKLLIVECTFVDDSVTWEQVRVLCWQLGRETAFCNVCLCTATSSAHAGLVVQARERGHMHVTDLVVHAHKFHNEAILLIHFSPRYKRQEILQALDTNLPPALRAKCIPFLNGFA